MAMTKSKFIVYVLIILFLTSFLLFGIRKEDGVLFSIIWGLIIAASLAWLGWQRHAPDALSKRASSAWDSSAKISEK